MKLSFLDILDQKIEIPIIQRDYAQGRENKQVDKIRHDFLDAIFNAIEKRIVSKTYELELEETKQTITPLFLLMDNND
jgi:hypothetical protein